MTEPATWLGIDLGTTSVKVLLLHADGSVRSEANRPYPLSSPRPGWAEADPEAWWSATAGAVRACLARAGAQATVAGIGLSGNMHGVVLCDADASALRPAILWPDTRSTEELAAYHALPRSSARRLANPPVTGFAGPTLLWLKRHEPEVYQRTCWALQPKDWLRMRLTGVAASEPSDASGTLLYDLETDLWYDDVIAALGLRRALLAELRASSTLAGRLSSAAASSLGLRPHLPVATGGGDTACAAFGSGLDRPGDMQLTVGSGLQIVAILDRARADPTLRTHLFRSVDGGWYAMAAIQNAGLALEWARSMLGLSWDTFYDEAFERPPGCEGLTFLPYLTGERTPHLNSQVRGAWTGLSLRHGRGDMARAAFEGVAFACLDGLEALRERGVDGPELRLAGGGTLRPAWRQLLADVAQRPLLASAVPSASALGAARLAALAAGRPTPAPAPVSLRVAQPRPVPDLAEAYQRFRNAYRTPAPLSALL